MTAFRALGVTVIIVLLLMGGLLTYLFTADLGWLKPRVEQAVGKATGREFQIEGNFTLTALPTTHLVAEGARLGNAAWSEEPDMLRIGHASVELDPLSLLAERIVIRKVVLDEVRLRIETDPESRSNLDFQADELAADEGGLPRVVVELVEVRDAQVTYSQPESDPQEFTAERLTVTAQLAPERIQLDPLAVTMGDSDLRGNLTVATGESPGISGTLSATRVNLTPEQTADSDEAVNESQMEANESDAVGDFVFKDESLPLEVLRSANVDLSVSIAELIQNDITLKDVQGSATLTDGILGTTFESAGPAGGAIRGRFDLDASEDNVILDSSLYVRNLRLNLNSGEDADIDIIPAVGVTLELTAQGATPRMLASGLNGRLLVTQGRGRIESNLVGRFSGDIVAQVFTALNPFSKDDQHSNWECTVIGLDVENGNANVSGMLAQGEKVKIVGGGGIDLETEKIDLEFNTKPREGVGVSADMFVTPFVKVGGTLADPGVGLNAKGALLEGGAAIFTGGLSILAKAALDRASGETDECQSMLDRIGDHQPIQG